MVPFSEESRIVIAPASFKGSLSAVQVAEAMTEGLHDVLPTVRPVAIPLSDGGEGLVDVLASTMGAERRSATVQGPLPDQRVRAEWALTADRTTAIIEMAAAAGLPLVPVERRDPGVTTTYGVGELLREALNAGASRIILGLGGSATNDGGAGMATALGYRFLDDQGKTVPPGGRFLARLSRIDASGRDPRLDRVTVIAPCDVVNPLTGPQGAAMVYGIQKGGDQDTIHELDRALVRFAAVVERDCHCAVGNVPGAGAAGGLGAGALAFLHAELKKGIDVVLETVHFTDQLHGADAILTGEGRLDAQTRYGKVMQGVLQKAHLHRIPVFAVVGSIARQDDASVHELNLADVESLVGEDVPIELAMREAATLVRARTAAMIARHRGPG
jgi:glycerate kinase